MAEAQKVEKNEDQRVADLKERAFPNEDVFGKGYVKDRGRVFKNAAGEEIVDNQQAAMLNGVHTYNRDGMQELSLDTGAKPKVLPNSGTVASELMRTSTSFGAQGKAINAAPDTPFIEEPEEPVVAPDVPQERTVMKKEPAKK